MAYRKIQIRRGLEANLPVLSEGELALTVDSKDIYIGSNAGNLTVAKQSDIPNAVVVNNTLISTSTTEALSAAQGKALKDEIVANKSEISSHLADMDYQTPTVVGDQIRIQKQGSGNRLFFKLDSDLSGNISISLDGGTTSLPVNDIDGNPVTSIPKGFVEVIKDAVNFTLRPRGEVHHFDFFDYTYVGVLSESWFSGNYSQKEFATDGVFLYIISSTSVIKYDHNTKQVVGGLKTAINGGTNEWVRFLNGNLYIGILNERKIIRIDVDTMTISSESPIFSAIQPYGPAAFFDGYIFVGVGDKIFKLDANTLTISAESESYGGEIRSLECNQDSVFAVGRTINKVTKYSPTTLGKIAESVAFQELVSTATMIIHDKSLYFGGSSLQGLFKLNVDDLTIQSSLQGLEVRSLCVSNSKIVVGFTNRLYYLPGLGPTTAIVEYKIGVSDLALDKFSESNPLPGYGVNVASFDNEVLCYMGLATTRFSIFRLKV